MLARLCRGRAAARRERPRRTRGSAASRRRSRCGSSSGRRTSSRCSASRASSSARRPATGRRRCAALGAGTVYFDLNLKNRVGTPTKPTDTATMPDRAQKLYDFASQQTGCATPVVVFNELAGPGLVTPWSDTNAQYRANVLSLIQHIAALGAHPVLLIPAADRTPAATRSRGGSRCRRSPRSCARSTCRRPRRGSRGRCSATARCANAYRDAVTNLTSIGIPPNKVGLMVSFATTTGFGGRNGLEPVGRLVPGGEVAGARGAAGRGRDGHRVGLVVGVGEMERRRAGSREGSRRLRLAVGAVAVALRRAEAARPAVRHVAAGRPAQPAAGRARSA